MADLPPKPGSPSKTTDDTGTPRWVKVFGIMALVLIVLIIILHLTGHGLGRHTHRPPVTEQGIKRP